jgi:galactose oxidase
MACTSRCLSIARTAFCLFPVLLGAFAASTFGQDNVKGKWGPVLEWPNVGIHVHVLPTGKVLFWGRRKEPADDMSDPAKGLNFHDCIPWLWDGKSETDFPSPAFTALLHPKDKDGQVYNLFCSGHTFLADGRLLVVGGHNTDGRGLPHAVIFDPSHNTWQGINDMHGSRWYPTAITLSDGRVVVSSGGDQDGHIFPTQEVGDGATWDKNADFNGLPFYPRLHLMATGNVFMNGWIHKEDNNPDQFEGGYQLDVNTKTWTQINAPHNRPLRDYFTSVMYDVGKIMVAGGGVPPLDSAEIIDLGAAAPKWTATGNMNFKRRQHNATILPDGTVLVTGGTKGTGPVHAKNAGFNDLTPGEPIHSAELWDPKTGNWKLLAKESVDRCYHSTAVLLPDARVLSAGGGEYSPNNNNVPNPSVDTHADAQIFSPPYLFDTTLPRPDITSPPDAVGYGETFNVMTSHPDQIGKVSWIRLSSTTHSFNANQRVNFLEFAKNNASVAITAPAKREECPPGHYMLFLLNTAGVPSVARIIRIH